jgi:probable DNA metabolism protein
MEDDSHLVAGQLDEAMMAEDEKLFQSLWKSYFEAMAIKERVNLRLQRQHMPRRFWNLLTEMQ